MANIHGKGGDVTFAASDDTLGQVTAWTYTSNSDTARTTGMTASFESFVPGLDTFTGTCEAVAVTTIDIPADLATSSELKLELVAADAQAFTADAILTSITETASIDDVGRLTLAWEGNEDTVTYPA